MTTLKQKFQAESFLDWQIEIALRLFRERLQQKRSKAKQSSCANCGQTELRTINELLEELEEK